jgi:hypothetical protein
MLPAHTQDDYHGGSSGDYPIAGIGVAVSTFGPGLEIDVAVNRSLNFRLSGNYFRYAYNGNISSWNVYGNYTITFGSIGLTADWNFGRIIHLSGGVVYNMVQQVIDGRPQNNYSFGLVQVTPEQIGNVKITIIPNKVGPYLGLGLGLPMDRNHLVSFFFDIGAIYQGKPRVELEANGMLHPTATSGQAKIMKENLEKITFYPLIAMRLVFKVF